jgi:hypothetical protein
VELVSQIGPAKPHALHRAEPLSHRHLKQGHAPCLQQHRPTHLADHRRHRSRSQLTHGYRVQAIFVAKGQVIQQILDGLDAALGKLDRNPLPHELLKLDRCRKFQHTQMLPRTSNS